MNIKLVIDTETTGLTEKDRIIEIAVLELDNMIPTGKFFHSYINPGEEIQIIENTNIHGISIEMLETAPTFKKIKDELLSFIAKHTLVAHNAEFDIFFLNKELNIIGEASLTNPVIDTLIMAREQFPRMSNNLSTLCKRFKIALGNRQNQHSALLDSHLLAKVYYFLSIHEPNFDFRKTVKPKNLEEEIFSAENPFPYRLHRINS